MEHIDNIDYKPSAFGKAYRVIRQTRRARATGSLPSIRPHFLGINRVAIKADYDYPPHRHSDYEVVVPIKGSYRCGLNSVELRVDPDHLLLIKPGDWHEAYLQHGNEHVIMQFTLREWGAAGEGNLAVFAGGIRPARQMIPMDREAIMARLRKLEEEERANHVFSGQIQDAVMEALFWELLRAVPGDRLSAVFQRRSRDQTFVRRFLQYIEDRVTAPLDPDAMAEALGYSKSAISKKCRQLLGMSPQQLLMRQKVITAARLLGWTEKPVKSIAFELAFKNPYHFSRVFKSHTGKSPTQFREGGVPSNFEDPLE